MKDPIIVEYGIMTKLGKEHDVYVSLHHRKEPGVVCVVPHHTGFDMRLKIKAIDELGIKNLEEDIKSDERIVRMERLGGYDPVHADVGSFYAIRAKYGEEKKVLKNLYDLEGINSIEQTVSPYHYVINVNSEHVHRLEKLLTIVPGIREFKKLKIVQSETSE